MRDPWTDFWALAVVGIAFAIYIQLGDNKKNQTTDNQKYVIWVIVFLLVHSEYRVSSVKQAFLDASPKAYYLWEEMQRGPDTD